MNKTVSLHIQYNMYISTYIICIYMWLDEPENLVVSEKAYGGCVSGRGRGHFH